MLGPIFIICQQENLLTESRTGVPPAYGMSLFLRREPNEVRGIEEGG